MEFINEVNTKIEVCIESESDIRLKKGEKAYVNVSRYDPLVARTYMQLPKKLQDKQAIINVLTEKSTNAWNRHFE